MTFFKKNPGETLMEIVVATVILITVLTSAFTFLNRGLATNLGIINRIVATEIAREGAEAVRNIRDTNWLKYSGDRRNKWLCLDEPENDCPTNITADGFFQVDFFEEQKRYFLEELGNAELLNLETSSNEYERFQLFETDTGRLTYKSDGNTPTIFYRQIELIPETASDNDLDEVKLKVISRVKWREGNIYSSTVIETHLFDFYERDAYDE